MVLPLAVFLAAVTADLVSASALVMATAVIWAGAIMTMVFTALVALQWPGTK